MKRLTDEKRNALLVVAALLVTVTYQAILSPPRGLWQDDLFELNITDVLRRSSNDLFKLNIRAPHRAGSAIALNTHPFAVFVTCNSLIFYFSIVLTFVLVPPGVKGELSIAAVLLHVSYSCSMGTASDKSAIVYFVIPVIFSIVTVVLVIALRRLSYLLNLIRKELKKKNIAEVRAIASRMCVSFVFLFTKKFRE